MPSLAAAAIRGVSSLSTPVTAVMDEKRLTSKLFGSLGDEPLVHPSSSGRDVSDRLETVTGLEENAAVDGGNLST